MACAIKGSALNGMCQIEVCALWHVPGSDIGLGDVDFCKLQDGE